MSEKFALYIEVHAAEIGRQTLAVWRGGAAKSCSFTH
jgi:hypothetical protein